MIITWQSLKAMVCSAMLLLAATGSASAEEDLWFFVLVKSNNYAQDQEGSLSLLNYHFFSELFSREPGRIRSATLGRRASGQSAFVYEDRGEAFYFEGGHFNSLEAVDAAHPNDFYRFRIELASGESIDTELSLAGPDGLSDIPAPIEISFFQQGRQVKQNRVNPGLPLRVRWSPYSNGRADEKGIVDDMIFVVFQNCHGERVFHTGLPFKDSDYMKYHVTETIVPVGRFEAGQTYAMFVEFPHVVDSTVVNDVPGFTAYATATYTDITTSGAAEGRSCPEKIPPLDTGQTDRMDVQIN